MIPEYKIIKKTINYWDSDVERQREVYSIKYKVSFFGLFNYWEDYAILGERCVHYDPIRLEKDFLSSFKKQENKKSTQEVYKHVKETL